MKGVKALIVALSEVMDDAAMIAAEVRLRLPGAETSAKSVRQALWEHRHPKAHRRNCAQRDQTAARAKFARNHPGRLLFHKARNGAEKRSLAFDLTVEDVLQMLEPMTCMATGLPLSWAGGRRHHLKPSLDRIDSQRGYSADNVQVVCWMFNQMKGAYSEADFALVAEEFLRTRKSRVSA
jgi:hypothetical protein